MAAFSKSVICTSGMRNSTRQPMAASGLALRAGGGFSRADPQFVPCSCSQRSALSSSLLVRASGRVISTSRTNRWPTCAASNGSTPASSSTRCVATCTAGWTSFNFAHCSALRSSPMYRSLAEALEFRTVPSSSSWRSSQVWLKVIILASTSATSPRKKGEAAESARKIGDRTRYWSVRNRASDRLLAKKVACTQHCAAPYAQQSM
mmetsp:Transcript_60512/g.162335  ORF Transcript_60512/g.162335 Transcript_60512/m.162335 type:complete len:206 (-) Transcript_60512:707-1324(-)